MSGNFLTLILIFLLAQTSAAQDTIVDKYLPVIDNWSETSREIYFADDLFFLINGGAELYLEYGFDQVVSSEMINEKGQKAVIELYKMQNPEAAHGIYSFNARSGEATDIAEESISGKDYLMFRQADIYGIVRLLQGGDEILKELAVSTVANIPATDNLSEFISKFNDIQHYRKTYIEGNIALNNFYYFGNGNIFSLYRAMVLEESEHKIIVIDYSSVDDRSQAQAEAKNTLLASSKFELVTADNSSLQFSDRNNESILIVPYEKYLIVSLSPTGSYKKIEAIKQLL